MLRSRQTQGFTLLEILVALFIFAILSVMLASALNRVISAHERTEFKAQRLRELQMALLVFSRDLEQAVNRPVTDATGRDEPAFWGSSRVVGFTHTGKASVNSQSRQSTLARVQYAFSDNSWWRRVWPVLDQAPQTKVRQRQFLADVTEGYFEYLDKQGRFHNEWRGSGDLQESLPRAVRVTIKLKNWGSLSQLYLIAADESEQSKQPSSDESKSPPPIEEGGDA